MTLTLTLLCLQKEEATLTMLRSPRTDGLLRCPRRACGELLGGVRALTFHLHIHAVGAGSYACVRCGGGFESARELAGHSCAKRRARGACVFFSYWYLPPPPARFFVDFASFHFAGC